MYDLSRYVAILPVNGFAIKQHAYGYFGVVVVRFESVYTEVGYENSIVYE